MTRATGDRKYELVQVHREGHRQIRAFLSGPGIRRGIWYRFTSAVQARTFVKALNETYACALALRSHRVKS